MPSPILWDAEDELRETNRRLSQALEQVKQLHAIIPICSYCKKARNDQQYWEELDEYLMAHTDAQLSHGICPGCYERLLQPQLETMRTAQTSKRAFVAGGQMVCLAK